MIPPVKTWKVKDRQTGKTYFIDTINKRFARMLAIERFGLWGHRLAVSVPMVRIRL